MGRIYLFLLVMSFGSYSLLAHARSGTSKTAVDSLNSHELQKKAQQEIRFQGKKQAVATDAQVQQLLQLKDPRKEVITRTWDYQARLRLKNQKLSGVVQTTASKFDLSQTKNHLLTTLDFGAVQDIANQFYVGGQFGVGFGSVQQPIQFDSGFSVDEGHLTSTLMTAGLMSGYFLGSNASSIYFQLDYQRLTVAQVSNNDLANFVRTQSAWIGAVGLNYPFQENFSLFLQNSQVLNQSSNEVQLSPNFFELGARISW